MNKNVAFELGKMRSLIERMEGKFTPYQAILNEERLINEALTETGGARKLFNSSEDLFKKLDGLFGIESDDDEDFENKIEKLRNTDKSVLITMGYVDDVKWGVKEKVKNPHTNRPITRNVYRDIGENVKGLICVTYYTYNYKNRYFVKYDYGKRFKPQLAALRAKYNIPEPPPRNRKKPQTQTTNTPFDQGQGVSRNPFNDTYNPQNMCSMLGKKILFYPIDEAGHTFKGVDGKSIYFEQKDLQKFLAAEVPEYGKKVLQDIGASQSVIDQYAEEFNGLNMDYKSFRADKILSICAEDKVEGKFIYVNPNVNKVADGMDVNVDPKDLYDIAYQKYEKDIKAYEAQNTEQNVNPV
jgi:hypothetical protein